MTDHWVARGPRRTLRLGDVVKNTLGELQLIADWKRPDYVDERRRRLMSARAEALRSELARPSESSAVCPDGAHGRAAVTRESG